MVLRRSADKRNSARALPSLSVCAVVSLVAACTNGPTSSDGSVPFVPWQVEAFPTVPIPADNPMSDAKIELGRLLFHDPLLSSDRAVACVTCHGQIWGMSDGLPVSVGVGGVGPAGTGRTGPNRTRRNSQTLWNAAFRETQFWDGRAATLEDQVIFPLQDPNEMNRMAADVVRDIQAIPAYVTLFRNAFPNDNEPVSTRNLQRAIAAFERTLISNRAPYDRFVAGDTAAMSEDQVAGMQAFADRGCPQCHTPPLFESQRFESSLVPPIAGVMDEGRAEVTRNAADARRFRVPTLRNVRESGPYFHTGSAATVEDAIALEATRRTDLPNITAAQIEAIGLFLKKSLMDAHNEPVRPTDVPSGLPVPADGYRIPR